MKKHTSSGEVEEYESDGSSREQAPNGTKKKKSHAEHWQVVVIYMMIYDAFVVNAAYFIGLWFRFDCKFGLIPYDYLNTYLKFIPAYAAFCVGVFYFLKLYNSIWRYASYSELNRVGLSSIITTIFHFVGTTILSRLTASASFSRMPISYYFFGAVIQFMLVLGIRFVYRFILLQRNAKKKNDGSCYQSRVMLIGAGAAGQMLLRDLRKSRETNEKVCCIIDDDSNKWYRYIDGVLIVGGRDDIMKYAEDYHIDKIFLAIPSASAEERRDILNICKETGCELKNLPGMYQFVLGEITVNTMKKVDVEDLLGREPIKVNLDEIFAYLKGKVILVTGGGGSIGSELCRQIAGHGPKQLIIFDVYENNAYEIEQELKKSYPELNLVVLIGSVRDSRRITEVFETYRPEVVYHAAAHKHVPLMEGSPCESIKNNVLGTYKTAYAAMANGCQRFVLISTDKAVNPTNIMGASKRLCEMVIQTFDRLIKEGHEKKLPIFQTHAEDEDGRMIELKRFNQHARTEFVAVRFGNVLGSNGSVIPHFKKQIAEGRPVTVTHPDIIRYFMTIPEAVSLVLQAGVYAGGGEIFVLDMGEPVKIDTLARNLIKLSGFKPDVDIKIEYTGLRPGEKLFEEKLMAEEGMKTTPNQQIHIGLPIDFDAKTFLAQLGELMEASYKNDADIRRLVTAVVPTYHPADDVGSGEMDESQQAFLREVAVALGKQA